MLSVGDRLRISREKKNLKQTQVRERTGINNKTLSGYEKGVSEPDFETLKILADLYEVSVDYLLGRVSAYSQLPEHIKTEVDEKLDDILKELTHAQKENLVNFIDMMQNKSK